ncbi:ATP-binding cassette domain-containing protein [Acidiferrimicrobium sp. IK]|uniref:branched-chain amino acid ABC transporter permease/ATP-binding protein n=1 Tax=Acidiferrimicrobium sp. IK TaxID=2871700 RepID=UPI0021CB75ED|nr:branched-chain amino acid ABC transporter permease/ATP-binding protein [Acidiferrimicrobium sp. IK]MCU4183275.1 ATP-binding cassette domain-containing protein [Acidiferrimicrobium sp. IK]
MHQVFQYAVLGVGSGALLGLLATGLVVVHRGSGVVNFAHGAVAMFGTFVFWDLDTNLGIPYWLAVACGVAVSALLGLLVQQGILRWLKDAAPVTRLIATLGALTILEQAASHKWASGTEIVTSAFPHRALKFLGASIGEDKVIVLGISIALVAVLGAVYRFTRFGRATTAVRENRRAAAALGYSPDVIASLNWMIGSALAGFAGILLAPFTGLSVTAYTLLILPALAGAVLGNLMSFPLALLGGLVVGIVQSEFLGYVTTPGWSQTVPFLLVVVVLIIRGGNRGTRTSSGERAVRLGSGRIRPGLVAVLLVLAIVLVQFALSASWRDAVTTSTIGAVIVLSFVPLTGYSGQLSLAQFAFAGWGAWVAGRLVATTGMPFLAALIIAVLAAVPLGLLLGLVCLRTRGVYLAIATLGLAVALEQLLFLNANFTGGTTGTTVGKPHLFGLDINSVTHANRYGIFCLVLLALASIVVVNLRRGRSGRRLLAARANDRAAASLGVRTAGGRLFAFGLSSAIAAMGGVLLAFRDPTITYSGYSTLASIELVAQAVVGGVGWIGGAVAGGLGQIGGVLSTALGHAGQNVSDYLPLILAALLVVTVLQSADGVAALIDGQLRSAGRLLGVPGRRYPSSARHTAMAPVTGQHRVRPATLTTEGLAVRFGGVVALDGLSLTVRSGEVVGVIGPNGAGKTTFIDALTGFVRISGGRVRFDEVDVTGAAPATLAQRGLTRSFQSLELFGDMTVLENLRVASEPRDSLAYLTDLVRPTMPPLSPAARAAITEFDLAALLDRKPSELSYGQRRLVGIARAVATEPSILCLDEPAAGLDDRETEELSRLIRRLVDDWGIGIVLVEHHVEMVMNVCDHIHVLNFGKEIAHGAPADVRRNDAVISAYLGADPSIAPATPDPVHTANRGEGS